MSVPTALLGGREWPPLSSGGLEWPHKGHFCVAALEKRSNLIRTIVKVRGPYHPMETLSVKSRAHAVGVRVSRPQ